MHVLHKPRCALGDAGHGARKAKPRHRAGGGIDIWTEARDTRTVRAFGSSRRRLAEVLNAAFAEGLLSEQTYSYRVAMLYGPKLIDQQRLIGDLTLRRHIDDATVSVRRAWNALVASVGALVSRRQCSPRLLLALDSVERPEFLIGRHSRCDVVLDDLTVSRRHARLTLRDGSWVIQDLASTNGTSLNGMLVRRAALRCGDVIRLGNQAVQID